MSEEKIRFEDLIFGAQSARPAKILACFTASGIPRTIQAFGTMGNVGDIKTTIARGRFAIMPKGDDGRVAWCALHPLLSHHDDDQ
jgi:hypothetical protein